MWKFSDSIVCYLRNKQDIPDMPLLNLAADDLLHSKNTLKHPELKYGIFNNIYMLTGPWWHLGNTIKTIGVVMIFVLLQCKMNYLWIYFGITIDYLLAIWWLKILSLTIIIMETCSDVFIFLTVLGNSRFRVTSREPIRQVVWVVWVVTVVEVRPL